jgi:TatD DNase family protein
MVMPDWTLIDSHCHLDHPRMEHSPEALVRRAAEAGVRQLVTIESGWTLEDNAQIVEIARQHEAVHAVVGVHPHDAQHVSDELVEGIRSLSRAPEVVGIGETGLDFHYDNSPRAVQEEVFRRWIRVAREEDLPLVVHTRSAEAETLAALDAEPLGDAGVIIHCFSGTASFADACLERGFLLSIPGIVTFKRAGDLPEVARRMPLDRMLIETDSPYLAPIPHRGSLNEPAHVALVAAFIAQLRGMEIAEVAAATTANARRVFRLPELV